MKKRILTIMAFAAMLSLASCGKVVEGQISTDTKTTTKAAVTASTTAVTTTEEKQDTTTTVAVTSAATEENATEAAQNTYTETATEAQQQAVPAGGGDQASNQPAPQQANGVSSDTAPTPNDYNYGPAPVQYSYDGLTYIQGVLIANKSYSLPSDFNPGLDATCQNQFYKLQNAAAQQGLNIWLSSGFRSYDYQAQIYNNYVARDGQAAADTYSARAGYSEHQTGLAIDVNQIDDSFAGTPEAIWLENHCHEYGFILRYPQGKQGITGYQYESWHIRYVGTDMSYPIHASGLTLEEYFGIDSYYH
ncbi:D-alanyl-D-alanine carboxypeptidase [Ruminococcus flavefaciens]|uniref:D-alanyl-D-alanine carboxypeptidase n=1 Tax=Ruminococcus flavefaciens TaxID=1265 RepID=A0A1H6L441_RUMFL|nr:M15 family metallopeptidase [Ruminococcus flavefaciens]SEH78974.1 D-alanyl-D-alanine carboxypeptidase [Ruminococcus flavefaciens]